ncbi:MAG: MBL fold metallo-hydrolase [Ktedonobacteraceae bacterium]|nr:MBL fold metallo-hydrolase [Ktedonobacteraceae bacterium]
MAENPRFLLRFWGVRGSYPTPGRHTLRHGGNTACVEVQAGPHILIFDAGSGIIGLGKELMDVVHKQTDLRAGMNIALFLTHGHGDHLVGFPFFTPLFDPHAHIDLFGPQLAGQDIEQLVTPLMSPPYFPVDVRQLPSQRTFHTIRDEQCIIWSAGKSEPEIGEDETTEALDGELRVRAKFTSSHPLNGSIVYRIEYAKRCVVYATDVEWGDGYEQAFLDFVEGADVLIHDAQYTTADYKHGKHGFGHSTVDMAVGVAMAAHVQKLILFHHEPTYDDNKLDTLEKEARRQFKQTRSACEGMEIDLLA